MRKMPTYEVFNNAGRPVTIAICGDCLPAQREERTVIRVQAGAAPRVCSCCSR